MSKFLVLIALVSIVIVSEGRRRSYYFEEDEDTRQLRALRSIQMSDSYQPGSSRFVSEKLFEGVEPHHKIRKRVDNNRKTLRTSYNPVAKVEAFGPDDDAAMSSGMAKLHEKKSKDTKPPINDEEYVW